MKSPLKVLIVDDEPLARALVGNLLKDQPEFIVVGECGNGKDAVSAIRKQTPDIVFLDVQMPEMDGLAVLEEVGEANLPAVIFVTAYDQYAIRAFDFHAVDYLLKPFSRDRFTKALTRAQESLAQRGEDENIIRSQMTSLLETHKTKPAHFNRLFLKDRGRIVVLEPELIDWLEADDKYVHVHTAEKSFLVRRTLSALESELDPENFTRIHRSSIVNVSRIKEMHPMFNGEYAVVLSGGKKLTLSRSYKNRFFEKFGKNY